MKICTIHADTNITIITTKDAVVVAVAVAVAVAVIMAVAVIIAVAVAVAVLILVPVLILLPVTVPVTVPIPVHVRFFLSLHLISMPLISRSLCICVFSFNSFNHFDKYV